MYDHQTESLWLQVKRQSIAGPMTGAELKKLASTVTTWGKWRKLYPQTRVLSVKTGYARDYTNDPYADYYKSRRGFFSFLKPGPGAEEKELIIGVEIEGSTKAYRTEMLRDRKKISDEIHGRSIVLKYDAETDTVTVQDNKGSAISYISTYWMVWEGIYPESAVYDE